MLTPPDLVLRDAYETKLHGIHKKRSCIECSAQNVPTPSCPARHPPAGDEACDASYRPALSTYLLYCAYLLIVGFLLPLVSSFEDIIRTGRGTAAGILKKANGSR